MYVNLSLETFSATLNCSLVLKPPLFTSGLRNLKMLEWCYAILLLSTVLISIRIAPKVHGNVNNELLIRPNTIKVSPCVQLLTCMQTAISRRKGAVCREKLLLLYLCMLLFLESYASEPNPGPRTPRYPCEIVGRQWNGQHPEFNAIHVNCGTIRNVCTCQMKCIQP